MNIFKIFEDINNKFYKENYYYLYSMSIYHALGIIISFFVPSTSLYVFYKLTFTPQATQDILTQLSIGSISAITWTFLLLCAILVLDVIFLYIIVDEFLPKFITMKRIFFIETSILTISFLIPYLRDVFIFLSINTLIITLFYKIIKYEKVFTGLGFMKYIMLTISYISIIELVLYPVILGIRIML